MKSMLIHKKRIGLIVVALAAVSLSLHYGLGFDWRILCSVMGIEGALLILSAERAVASRREKKGATYILFNLLSLTVVGMAVYLIGQTGRIQGMHYIEWLKEKGSTANPIVHYEVGTELVIGYVVITGVYAASIIRLIKLDVSRWLPSFWCLVLGSCLNIYFKPGFSHRAKISCLIIGCCILALSMVISLAKNSEDKISLKFNTKYYLILFLFMSIGIWGVGSCLPEMQELPGTRWLHHAFSSFGVKSKLQDWLPYETNLNSDVPFSQAELFEVQASEPLYLRDVAYSDYRDGKWSLPPEGEYDEYIPFKSQYVEAEYHQADALLDEILWMNSQDKSILSEYAWLANYEKSVVTRRKYKVMQNPINKVNYFTVNGVKSIEDKKAKDIYYYHSLNNCYFYSDRLVEPGEYEVTYYSRVPRMGSREYVFLHQIDGRQWEKLYQQVMDAREKYELNYKEIPKVLLTYTQLVQYKNAKYSFMQVPQELKGQLKEMAEAITSGQISDWERAQSICDYLKQNYVYTLQSRKQSGERVLEFLFNTREGLCQDFATSMVLLCRSAGIPAKYVTGYLAQEKNSETGNYIVREKDAHAFVEAYIAGYGWMSFDPTPGETNTESGESASELKPEDLINLIGTLFIVAICFLLTRAGRKYIAEKWWQIRYAFETPEKKIEQLFISMSILLESKGMERTKSETLSQYNKRLEEQEIVVSNIIKPYEKMKYGMIGPDECELKAAWQCYQSLRKYLKKKQQF